MIRELNSLINDLYYKTIKSSWISFFIIAGLVYLLINLIFACIYYLSPALILNVSTDSIWELFVFSFQTSSTIGYGHFLPQSNSAHIIVMFDAISGIFYAAIITGLAFSKFARPNAKILYTDKVLFTTFNEKPAVMFRLANGRDTEIVDAQVKVSALIPYETSEGFKMRRFYKLNLLNDNNPIFSLSWTLIYIIDEGCPLYGLSLNEIKELDVLFCISFTGIDNVLSQNVHSNLVFRKENFVEGKKFKDILKTNKLSSKLDMTYFHEVDF